MTVRELKEQLANVNDDAEIEVVDARLDPLVVIDHIEVDRVTLLGTVYLVSDPVDSFEMLD